MIHERAATDAVRAGARRGGGGSGAASGGRRGALPLSPVLLAGLALRPLPPALLRPALGISMRVMRGRHPELFDRLGALAGQEIVIDPSDLPFCFVLRLDARAPSLTCVRDGDAPPRPAAVIRGPLLLLIDLLEGRVDGDAVFFSRQLTVAGDTEAVVTLRNAIDSAEVRIADDLLSLLGPLAAPARRAGSVAGALLQRAAGDLEAVRTALISRVSEQCEAQAAHIHRLEDELAELRRELHRAAAGGHRAQAKARGR